MLCVYGVTRASHPGATATGVAGGPVRTVAREPLAAIVSDLAADADLLARRRDVAAYMTVLEDAAGAGDVLPFRFGTLVADEDELRDVLADGADDYLRLLDELAGLVQMTLKAVRNDDDAVRVVLSSDVGLRRWAAKMSGSPAVNDRLALGERVAAAVAELTDRDTQEILRRLAPLARDIVTDECRPPTVLSASLLVHPDSLRHLDEAVAALHDDFGDRLGFDYTGPMPPYSFVAR